MDGPGSLPNKKIWALIIFMGIFGVVPMVGNLVLIYNSKNNWNTSENNETKEIEQLEYYNATITKETLSLFVLDLCPVAFGALACLIFPFFVDSVGRKRSLFVASGISVVAIGSQLLSSFLSEVTDIFSLIGQCLSWFSLVIFLNAAGLLLVEISPDEHRGKIGGLFGAFLPFATLLGSVLAFDKVIGERDLLTIGIIAFLLLQLCLFPSIYRMRESPWHYMIRKDDKVQALDSLLHYSGNKVVSTEVLSKEIENLGAIQSLPEEDHSRFGPFKLLFTHHGLRKCLLCAIAVCTIAVMPHILILKIHTIISLAQYHSNVSVVLLTMYLCVGVVGSIGTVFFIDSLGRRPLILTGSLTTSLGCALIAVFIGLPDPIWKGLPVIACLFGIQVASAIGIYPIHWTLTAELFPVQHRGNGIAMANLCAVIFFVIGLSLFRRMTQSSFIPYCTMAAVQFVCFVGLLFGLIETSTKGQTEIFAEVSSDVEFLRDLRKQEIRRRRIRKKLSRDPNGRDRSLSVCSSVDGRTRQSSFASLADDFEKDMAKPGQLVLNGSQTVVKQQPDFSLDDSGMMDLWDPNRERAYENLKKTQEGQNVVSWLEKNGS